MLNILLITVLIAVQINYISCDKNLTISVSRNDYDVLQYLEFYKEDIFPLIVIQNIDANPLNIQTIRDDIQKFYESLNIFNLLVVPADSCVVTNNYINGKDTHFPSLFLIMNGRLWHEKITILSSSNIEYTHVNAINYSQEYGIKGRSLLTFLRKEVKKHAWNQPGSQIIRQLASQARNSVGTKSSAPILIQSAFPPALQRNMASNSSNTSGITTTVTPVSQSYSFDPNGYLERLRSLKPGVGYHREDNQSTVRTDESGPGPNYPVRVEEEFQTRDFLSSIGLQEEYQNYYKSDNNLTPIQTVEFSTSIGGLKRRRSQSSSRSPPGPPTKSRK